MLALAQAYLQGVRVNSTEICHHPFEPAVDLSRRMSRFHEPDQYLSILTHSQTGDRRRAGSPKFGHVRLFVCLFRPGFKTSPSDRDGRNGDRANPPSSSATRSIPWV